MSESPRATIRRAVTVDAERVAACVHAAYAHYVPRLGKPAPLLDDYARVVSEAEVFVAESERSVVGVLVLRKDDEGFLLDNVAVHPSRWKTGLGRELLALAEQRARAAGHDSIYLYTHALMTENQALYARLGYAEYARRSENGRERVYMRKRFESSLTS